MLLLAMDAIRLSHSFQYSKCLGTKPLEILELEKHLWKAICSVACGTDAFKALTSFRQVYAAAKMPRMEWFQARKKLLNISSVDGLKSCTSCPQCNCTEWKPAG
jgi:hypothetical protein